MVLNLRSDGKVAVVTGASRGIGRGIAIALAEAGAIVVCGARDRSRLDAVVAEIEAGGGRAQAHVVDVTSRESVESLIASALAAHGRIDVLVNNAGITRDNLLLRMKPGEWDEVMATNLTSVFISTQAVLKSMLKQRAGSIINIGSVVGLTGNGGQANYAAAKAGLIGFSKSIGTIMFRSSVPPSVRVCWSCSEPTPMRSPDGPIRAVTCFSGISREI